MRSPALEYAMDSHGHGERGFTLLDVMIVVVCLGILASVTIPLLTGHLSTAQASAAKAQLASVRHGLDMYFQQHRRWPETIEPEMFQPPAPVVMPRGWQLTYSSETGELELIEVPAEDLDTALDLVYVD